MAITAGNPTIALSAAAELPRMTVDSALALLLVLRDRDPERYERAAVRFAQLMARELRLSLAETQLALAALNALGGKDAATGASALMGLLEARGERRAARRLEEWLAR